MNLTDDRLRQLDDPALSADKRALLRCRIAAELIHTGKYEEAREALGGLWRGVGERPDLKGLVPTTAAEVLLQCGVLSSWLGNAKPAPDAQERAKELLTDALRRFRSHGEQVKASEAKYELGLCYYWLGAYDKARDVLKEAAEELAGKDAQLKAKILIRQSFVEIWTSRYHEAISILEEAREFFEGCGDALKGRWHGHMALALRRLATAGNLAEFADRAIIEYTAAAFHFEQAQHESYCARALNNIGFLLYKLGRYEEAHGNLDRAVAIFDKLKDESSLAQVNETRARVLVAERRYEEAKRIIAGVIETFESGRAYGMLADALTIQGVVWSRLGLDESSVRVLRRAMAVAQEAGALSHAGPAALAMIEEHGAGQLSEGDLYALYRRADEWLKDTQDAEEVARLRACGRVVIERLAVVISKPAGENLSLHKAVEAYEARLIERALEGESGAVTKAAKRLGISHQSLIQILNTRHRNLLDKRTPPVPRRRSYTKKG